MTAAARILDRLQRVKQSRPNSWMSACPCCESRKGRPLAITEAQDGRVLLHAFCGRETGAVLHRIGLEIGDLFDRPIEHACTSRSALSACATWGRYPGCVDQPRISRQLSRGGAVDESKKYDPRFSEGNRTHTVLDVYRDHHARQGNCYCAMCWAAKEIIKRREAECEHTRPG